MEVQLLAFFRDIKDAGRQQQVIAFVDELRHRPEGLDTHHLGSRPSIEPEPHGRQLRPLVKGRPPVPRKPVPSKAVPKKKER
jgi:hypothetical protein